jgi:hypothetical protein
MMPPREFSRFTFTNGVTDASGRMILEDREPFRYVKRDDNVQHVVRTGDTLFSLAARYFKGFDRPDGLWWIIADFQPQPILDPTLLLVEGSVVIVPSVRTVHEDVFSEKRRGA